MSKNAIFALLVGLVVGGLVVWLLFGFTDVGTLLVRYQDESSSTTTTVEEQADQEAETQSRPPGQTQPLQQAFQDDPCEDGMEALFMSSHGSEYIGLEGDVSIQHRSGGSYYANWTNLALQFDTVCNTAGDQIRVNWFEIDHPGYGTEIMTKIHEETINVTETENFKNWTANYPDTFTIPFRYVYIVNPPYGSSGWQYIADDDKATILTTFEVNEGSGWRDLGHFSFRARPADYQNPIEGDWYWRESREGTFY